MESINEFAHIDLQWERDPEKKTGWQLVFDSAILLKINTGGWMFNRYTFVRCKEQSWRVKQSGAIEVSVYNFHQHNLRGKKAFQVGFRKKGKEGMFNPSEYETFKWKKLEGKTKGMAWFKDDLEIIRFERTGGSVFATKFTTSITTNKIDEKWLAIMLAAGFLSYR